MNAVTRPSAQAHDARLDRLAAVAVQVGLGLAPGQELVLTAPLEAAPLVRRITEHAYKAGAKLVTTLYSDEASTLARFQHARDEAFDYAPAWLFEGMAAAFREGAARMAIGGGGAAEGDRRRGPAAVGGAGCRPGRARQPLRFRRLQARARADHQLRHQLE